MRLTASITARPLRARIRTMLQGAKLNGTGPGTWKSARTAGVAETPRRVSGGTLTPSNSEVSIAPIVAEWLAMATKLQTGG